MSGEAVDTYSEREPVRRGIPIILGAVGIPLLALWSIVPVRHSVEDDLTAKSLRALTEAGVTGVDVKLTGRDARLVGNLANDAERQRVHDLVRTRVGVRHVDESGLTVGGASGGAAGTGASGSSDTTGAGAGSDTTTAGSGSDTTTVGAGSAGGTAPAAASTSIAPGGAASTDTTPDGASTTVPGSGAASTTTPGSESPTTTSAGAPSTTTAAGPTTTLTAAAAEVADDIKAVLAAGVVEFDTGSADLTAAGKATVAKLAAALAKQPAVSVAISGHTDNSGSAARNAQLSQARADAVRSALITQGIAGGRLTAKGFGSAKPIADNTTAAGRQKNRRIEFAPSGG